jgi:4'-phosphopantetheinyl transferase
VWSATDEKQFDYLMQLLSYEEKKRAAGFKYEVDRQHFVVAHGSLRLLLAAYLRVLPECLILVPDSHGKPRLADQADRSIRFNISHSGEMILYAFCVGREVGVDVEKIRSNTDELAIARQVFTQNEVSQVELSQGAMRIEIFFNFWTRMEALAKASGHGLGIIPQKGISLPPEVDGTSMAMTRNSSGHEVAWQIISLQPGAGYKAAVAAEGADWKIECMEWLH